MSDKDLARNDLETIKIIIGGGESQTELTGWVGFNIVRSIDSAADAFSFSFPWEATDANKRRFRAFRTTLVRVLYGSEVILTGTIEKLSPAWSAQRRELTIEGRSRCGYLVDVDALPVEMSGAFSALVEEIVPKTANASGAPVAAVSVTARPNFDIDYLSIEPGEKVFTILSKLAATQGLWSQPQPNGNLIFSKMALALPVTELLEDTHPVVAVSTAMDLTQRFHKYEVYNTAFGNLQEYAAVDNGVDVKRSSKHLTVEWDADPVEAGAFARSRGVIDGFTCTVNVVGWTVNGQVWRPGMICTVIAPSAMIYKQEGRFKNDLMVRRATMQLDETGGATTELEFTFPQVYAGGQPSFPFPWSLPDE